ncbi:lipopolysaccharide transport periplasmic protein LptA [Amylibacter kogurei]|uniref:Lipopolysaccharide transport periplasmic protein LptA n=2 Tax=Paramylibacter kogurei TaxID=1889778 RepID=A0A2G5KC37_9RHOB|nr:lipopolysaccharide transport periplasmic protein LptA [Amylibacter kogurei]
MKHILIASMTSLVLFSSPIAAQTGVSLSGPTHDTQQPVQVTADNLTVQQASNSAIFEGNAKVAQGVVRFGADKITVHYDATGKTVSDIVANGAVVFTNGAESAEAQNANFNVNSNMVILTGNVLLLQGSNAISGDTLRLNLTTNQATVSGNVKTVISPN